MSDQHSTSGWTAAHYPSGANLEGICQDLKKSVDFFCSELTRHAEALKCANATKNEFETVPEWLNAMWNHTCHNKEFMAADRPPYVRYICQRCKAEFSIRSSDVVKSKDFYERAFLKMTGMSGVGRKEIAEEMEKGPAKEGRCLFVPYDGCLNCVRRPPHDQGYAPCISNKDCPITVTVRRGDRTLYEGSFENCKITHSRDIEQAHEGPLGDGTYGLHIEPAIWKTTIVLEARDLNSTPKDVPYKNKVTNIEGPDPRGATGPQG